MQQDYIGDNMKTRHGFVSNSSSSSFLISLDVLNPTQIDMIKNHMEYARKMNFIDDHNKLGEDNKWKISCNDYKIEMYTDMDNFDMHRFLTDLVHVDPEDIEYGDY